MIQYKQLHIPIYSFWDTLRNKYYRDMAYDVKRPLDSGTLWPLSQILVNQIENNLKKELTQET